MFSSDFLLLQENDNAPAVSGNTTSDTMCLTSKYFTFKPFRVYLFQVFSPASLLLLFLPRLCLRSVSSAAFFKLRFPFASLFIYAGAFLFEKFFNAWDQTGNTRVLCGAPLTGRFSFRPQHPNSQVPNVAAFADR